MIFSVIVADKKIVDQTSYCFYTKTKLDQTIWIKILSEKFQPIALENIQFENWHTNDIKWTFLHVQLINIPIQGTQSNFSI